MKNLTLTFAATAALLIAPAAIAAPTADQNTFYRQYVRTLLVDPTPSDLDAVVSFSTMVESDRLSLYKFAQTFCNARRNGSTNKKILGAVNDSLNENQKYGEAVRSELKSMFLSAAIAATGTVCPDIEF